MVAAFDADGTPSVTTKRDLAQVKRTGNSRVGLQRAAYNHGLNGTQPPDAMSTEEQQAYEAGIDDRNDRAAKPSPKKTTGPGKAKPKQPERLAAGHPEPGDTPAADAFGPINGEPPDTSGGVQTPAQVTSLAHQGAGVLLGLIVYAVAINYLRSGTAGVKLWFEAKFFNQPGGGQSSPAAANNGSSTATPATTSPAGSSTGSQPI